MKHLFLTLFAVLALVSCQSNEEFTTEVDVTLNLSANENSVWHNNTRASSATKDTYYIFDANGICRTAAQINHTSTATNEKLLASGNYNVFCITNADPSGIRFESSMIDTNFTSQTMEVSTLTDVCLGQQPLSIVASKTSYHINVTVNHILAKLALSIAKVPADISTIKLTLGNLSKSFTLDGNFNDDGTTLDLDLQKATTANDDGTYDWTLPESLIYPCLTGATTTVITIVATDTSGKEQTYNTSSTTVCSSGTRTNLTTTWRTLKDYLSYGYTENPWTTTVQQGSFDM